MSHFYGTLRGNRGEATRCGSKASGLTTHAASWAGSVVSTVFEHTDKDGNVEDWVDVSLAPWRGSGSNVMLYRGPISGRDAFEFISDGIEAIR